MAMGLLVRVRRLGLGLGSRAYALGSGFRVQGLLFRACWLGFRLGTGPHTETVCHRATIKGQGLIYPSNETYPTVTV